MLNNIAPKKKCDPWGRGGGGGVSHFQIMMGGWQRSGLGLGVMRLWKRTGSSASLALKPEPAEADRDRDDCDFVAGLEGHESRVV